MRRPPLFRRSVPLMVTPQPVSEVGMQRIVSMRLGIAVLLCAGGAVATIGAQQAKRTFALEAQSPQFWTLVPHDAALTTIASGFGFTEGPVWDPGGGKGFLYVSDETLNKIFRVHMDGTKESVIALGDPDGNTFDAQHRLLDCASVLRAVIAITPDGHYKVLTDQYQGKKYNSPNDVI